MADQQSTERRTSAVATAGGAHPGVLLPYAYPGTRLGDPALDARRSSSAGSRTKFLTKNCKGCVETNCKACVGTGHSFGICGVVSRRQAAPGSCPAFGR